MGIWHGANFEFETIRQKVNQVMVTGHSTTINVPMDTEKPHRITVLCDNGVLAPMGDIHRARDITDKSAFGRALAKVFMIGEADDVLYVPNQRVVSSTGRLVLSYVATLQIFNRMVGIQLSVEPLLAIAIHTTGYFRDMFFFSVDDIGNPEKWKEEDLTKAYGISQMIDNSKAIIANLDQVASDFHPFESIQDTMTRGTMCMLYNCIAALDAGLIPSNRVSMILERYTSIAQSDIPVSEENFFGWIKSLISCAQEETM